MDLFSLIGGIRPLQPGDHGRKTAALHAGYSAVRQATSKSFEEFVAALPASITGVCLGSDAEDFYLSALLASALEEHRDLDVTVATVLHHIVLQLNFMTRFIANPAGPECAVFDGDPHLFPVAMANGNMASGIQVSPHPFTTPTWGIDNPSVKFAFDRLANCAVEDISKTLLKLTRKRVGCLFVEVKAGQTIDLAQRYADLAEAVGEDTFYVLTGEASAILAAAARLEEAHPDVTILSRIYGFTAGILNQRRAIVVISGIPALPSLIVDGRCERRFTIVSQAESDHACDIKYRTGENGEHHEWVKIKRPLALRSRTALSEEARRRLSDNQLFPHSLTVVRDGILVPWQNFNCVTFIHLNKHGEMISDIGEMNVNFAPECEQGKRGREFTVPLDRVLTVKGAAMPLTFTPGLLSFFSHFLLQCFPRVRILRDMKSDAKVIVDDTIKPKQLEMLRRVGIGPDRIVLRPAGFAVLADELIVPRPWPLVFSDYTLAIYEELAASVGPRTMPEGRRVLISREYRSTWRTMLTYPAVAEMLQTRFGFEEIRPESLSLDEEIHLYRDARMLIGAEGAGLYSSVYAKPGSTYVSIGDEDYIMPVIGSAATVRGFDVAYVFGESLRATSDVRRRLPSGHADYMVDPEAVAKLVKQLL